MDPVTLLIIVMAVMAATDKATDGWIVGGAKGAGHNLWKTETARARKSRARRRKANQATAWGRLKNAVGEETLVFLGAVWAGWKAGIRAEQQRRRARREAKRERRQALIDAPNEEAVEADQTPNDDQTATPNEEAKPEAEAPNAQVTPGSVDLNTPTTESSAVPNADGATPERKDTPLVSDINSAPEAIAAWEALYKELEPIVDDAVAVAKRAVVTSDSMGDFAIGSEDDAASMVRSFGVTGQKALEEVAALLSALKAMYSASIEAADGKAAAAHKPMQAA
jgi:hypothetical protein